MPDLLTPIIFVGDSTSSSEVEAIVSRCQQACTLDLLERLLNHQRFATPIVATSSPSLAKSLKSWPVVVEPDEGEFHFGRRLAELIAGHRIEAPFYVGGGAGPLLADEDLDDIAKLALAEPGCLVANNFYSSDFVAFTPGEAITRIALPSLDNDLAFSLQRQAGLTNVNLPRSAATQFDVDTPTDVITLGLHPRISRRAKELVTALDLDASRFRQTMRLFVDSTAEIVIAGRVGSHVLAHLETDLACRKRVFSEERGMRASGRESRGEVRSLLGFHLESVGPRRFFENLGALGQGMLLDTRVLFNHARLSPTARDRFSSDLFRFEDVGDPVIRDFTIAAAEAPFPVLLGGHSLVSGGLWALIEATWLEHDRELGNGKDSPSGGDDAGRSSVQTGGVSQ